MAELTGRRVLVVGATGGIGLATVREFAAAGADVTLGGRDGAKLATAVAEVGGEPALVDILDDASVTAMFKDRPAFDHVVVAAARTSRGPVRELPLADAKAAVESKFWGAYRVARAANVNEGGSITFVSGMFAHRPTVGTALQGSINAAVDALARGLALECAPVRVNSVSPGLIDTPLWSGMAEAARADLYATTAAKLPARRIGAAEDVARTILFVATNPFITGTKVAVDGGALLV